MSRLPRMISRFNFAGTSACNSPGNCTAPASNAAYRGRSFVYTIRPQRIESGKCELALRRVLRLPVVRKRVVGGIAPHRNVARRFDEPAKLAIVDMLAGLRSRAVIDALFIG